MNGEKLLEILDSRLRLNIGGVLVSIVTGPNAYCAPRKANAKYTHVEIGLWSQPNPELAQWAEGQVQPDGELTVYPYVPTTTLARYLAHLAKDVEDREMPFDEP